MFSKNNIKPISIIKNLKNDKYFKNEFSKFILSKGKIKITKLKKILKFFYQKFLNRLKVCNLGWHILRILVKMNLRQKAL